MKLTRGGLKGTPSIVVAVLATAGWVGSAWASSFGYAGLGQLVLALLVGGGVVLVLGAISMFWSNRIFFWVSLVLTVPVLCFAIYVAGAAGAEPFFLIPVGGGALGLAGLIVHAVRFRRSPAVSPGGSASADRQPGSDASAPPG